MLMNYYLKFIINIIIVFIINTNFQLDLGMSDVSDADCSAIRYVCECVSRRAGFMVLISQLAYMIKKSNIM
jgi:hypothetical protein